MNLDRVFHMYYERAGEPQKKYNIDVPVSAEFVRCETAWLRRTFHGVVVNVRLAG